MSNFRIASLWSRMKAAAKSAPDAARATATFQNRMGLDVLEALPDRVALVEDGRGEDLGAKLACFDGAFRDVHLKVLSNIA